MFFWKTFDFLVARASGELKTTAKFFRDFVLNHPIYNKDSIIGPQIMNEIILKALEIQRQNYHSEIIGNHAF